MPARLEGIIRYMGKKLHKHEGEALDNYVYGTLNNMGVMHGNKITPKGAAMERKTGDSLVAKTAALIPRRKRDAAG